MYKKQLTSKFLEEAKQSLLRYLPAEVHKNKAFIDIECESKLFSPSTTLLEITLW